MGLFIPDHDGAEGVPAEIPVHNDCGLPVELCICRDAPVRAEGKGFVDLTQGPPSAALIGETMAINLDVPGSEDEARRLIDEGWKVRVVSLQTSEVECSACGWGRDATLVFDCELGAGGEAPTWMPCQGCGGRIELSIELLSMIRRAYDGTI